MPNLSKSKILACRQCPKRLWLELNRPELRDDAGSEMAFAIGNAARTVFDPLGQGTFIDVAALGHAVALARSAELLVQGGGPLFEAGLSAAGALAYADVMLPDHTYSDLDGVQDGMMAQRAYQEAIASDTTAERKAQIESQLHVYCKLDTFAMVRIWEVFRRRTNDSAVRCSVP